ncbi:hypothetical protein [Pseudobacteroides cellulosolvens]|uniref:Uncharacterized protein n=1 Tax=Pseudobacteroides cellulosolvens ATCC 35603 = DSM 2933 TaxID=398512 RepID=A0A0L6JKG2_9FIRM|nr:hypothetical protein [Pseudobacteroides cellulosolvens]KNY26264.1 hypothetical protein Bccel_1526 [Pseudobacteroides cellulosolvens ATCC 35603 = DSM 2933]
MIKPKKSKYVRLTQNDKDVLLRLKKGTEKISGYDNFFKYNQFLAEGAGKNHQEKQFENIP